MSLPPTMRTVLMSATTVGQERSLGCPCGILQPQLRDLPAAPVVNLKPPGKMEPRAAVVHQSGSKVAVKGSEGNRIKARAKSVANADFQMT